MDIPSRGGIGQSSNISGGIPMRRVLLGGPYSSSLMFVGQIFHPYRSEPSGVAPAALLLLLPCFYSSLGPTYIFYSPLHPFQNFPAKRTFLVAFFSLCGPSFCGINEGVLKSMFTESPSLIAPILEDSKWERKRSRSVG